MHRIALAGIAVALVAAGTLAANAQSGPQRVRGTIEQVTADTITIKTADGKDQTLPLAPDVRIGSDKALTLADIKSGDYIGTGATKQPDGTLVADEVTVLAALRGAGEGQRPWTGGPNSSMTNANVDEVAMGTSGNVLKLSYKGGTAEVVVKPGTPIVTPQPGDRTLLVAGLEVVAYVRTGADGTATRRGADGREGWRQASVAAPS
ncbi:MAG: hypothetical protein WDM84_01840 [Bauldia sp.]